MFYTDNAGQNICNKVEKPSRMRQDQKSLISVFANNFNYVTTTGLEPTTT